MSRTLYLMRHCQTLFNLQQKVQGASDSPITELGRQQSLAAGRHFAELGLSFDHFYCSTSERTEDTLNLVLEGMGIYPKPYERMKGLKEFNRGIFEGEPLYLMPRDLSIRDEYFVPMGGETDHDASDRVFTTLLEIMARDGHESVLAVSHGGVGKLMLRRCGAPAAYTEGRLPNCVCFVYDYDLYPATGSGRLSFKDAIMPVDLPDAKGV